MGGWDGAGALVDVLVGFSRGAHSPGELAADTRARSPTLAAPVHVAEAFREAART